MKPILIVNGAEAFVKGLSGLAKKVKKVNKAKKKAVVKKLAEKKKAKPEEPPRESPFLVGTAVWVGVGTSSLMKGVIRKAIKPKKSEKIWKYVMESSPLIEEGHEFNECELYPASIFTLIATDATRMKLADFGTPLNLAFDGKATVWAVYRGGQRKPWCYYVFPEELELFENISYKIKTDYNYSYEQTGQVWKHPAAKCRIHLTPISSAPREILSYLGVQIYGRRWVSESAKSGSSAD